MSDPETKKDISSSYSKFEDWVKDLVKKVRPYFDHLWKVRKKLILFNSIVGLLVLIYLYLIAKPYFNSTVTILPEFGGKSSIMSSFSQLASLVGVRTSEGAPAEIYQHLITSEAVLEEVIFSKYKTLKYEDSVNLIDYFNFDEGDDEITDRQKFLNVYRALANHLISTDIDRLTKILSVQVTMPESQLSADVANKIAESLDKYIRTKRKSYASEQRYYIEKRIEDLRDTLTMAEEKLRNFSEQNRLTVQSPRLLLEKGRLMRDVEILNAVYVELNKQLEITKIDEIRETPVVNIKEPAKDPIYKAGPARVKSFITIMFLSLFFSSAYFLLKERFINFIKTLGSS